MQAADATLRGGQAVRLQDAVGDAAGCSDVLNTPKRLPLVQLRCGATRTMNVSIGRSDPQATCGVGGGSAGGGYHRSHTQKALTRMTTAETC